MPELSDVSVHVAYLAVLRDGISARRLQRTTDFQNSDVRSVHDFSFFFWSYTRE